MTMTMCDLFSPYLTLCDLVTSGVTFCDIVSSDPELANLGGKRHPMDIVFPLFPSKFTMDFPLSSTENIIICNN